MKAFGDLSSIQEIVELLERWDHAVGRLAVQDILDFCQNDACFFDLSDELYGLDAYEEKWQLYRPYLCNNGIEVQRYNVRIHAVPLLAYVYCYIKLSLTNNLHDSKIRWCRSTLCLAKDEQGWQLVHQHISVPIDMDRHSIKTLDFEHLQS